MSEALLRLRFTRLSDDRHRFEYRRADGSGETIEMETGGLLIHDLLHHAVESEAGLRGSFYGILAKIGGYEELSVAGGAALGGEIAIAERVVGAVAEAMLADGLDEEALVSQVAAHFDPPEERPPRWLTAAFIVAVRDRLRQLLDRWSATPFGQTMELTFG